MRGPWRSLAVVAAGSAVVLGGGALPTSIDLAQRTGASPQASAHAEPVTRSQSICPGPEALGIRGLTDTAGQTVSVTAAAAPVASFPSGFAAGQGAGSVTISGLPPGRGWGPPIAARGEVVRGQLSRPGSVLVTGAGSIAPGTVATQWSWTPSGDHRGLVTAACLPAATSSWLIGGGAGPGHQERLVLTNPGPNPVTVDLTVFGVKGPIQSSNGQGLVVRGFGRIVVLLDSIAGSEASPVVHVVAHGGHIVAVLNDVWLDGVVPRGGDDAVPVAAPARAQVIASVPVKGRAILRVAVPGATEAVVESWVLTRAGPRVLSSHGVIRVPARSTRDIDLSSLKPGTYAVQVRADVPVVAAAMVERQAVAGAPSDLAWSGASVPVSALAGAALPAYRITGAVQWLDLAATDGPAVVLVTTVGAGGGAGAGAGAHVGISTKQVDIAADSVAMVPLGGASSVWVTPLAGIGHVRGAVLTTVSDAGGALLSVTPLVDLTLTAVPSTVRQLPE